MYNIMTIDLEEWFHANYEDNIFRNENNYEIRVVDNTERLLELFEEHHVKATFFVLGYIAEHFPDLICKIKSQGHEISVHGYGHQLVYLQNEEEFRSDVEKSIHLVEAITGEKIKGYRAPSWSITEQSKWALSVLKDLGICYDSSIFPIKTFLYGIPDAPRFFHSLTLDSDGRTIAEVPPSTLKIFGKNIPFSGGFYFRFLPCWLIKLGISTLNRQDHPAILYLHPREIDVNQPKLKLKSRDRFIHYYGVRGCEKKLDKILQRYQFTSINNYYKL